MKSILSTIILGILAISCSKNDSYDIIVFPQKWKLIKMTGSFPNSETTGDKMEWQEFYIFNKDKSFIKNRESDGINTEVSGTYELVEDSDFTLLGETLYELTFNNNNTLIGSCFQGAVEKLRVDPTSIKNTWEACDGPGLEYERIE